MKQYNVGIIGATGMVGQRFATLLSGHPWFNIVALAASSRSAGKTYKDAVGAKWKLQTPMPKELEDVIIMDAENDIEKIGEMVDFVFCAVNMSKEATAALEEKYAKADIPVVSNNSAHRHTKDVPMVVPELNPEHLDIIPAQKKRLGTTRGFIAVKSNCSLQSYVPPLFPLHEKYGVEDVLVCTYQAISGAGKTFEDWPEILDNVIPYIGGEEEKSEKEPLKIWGKVEGDEIVPREIASHQLDILHGPLKLPMAPEHFLNYFEEDDQPQTKEKRNLEKGMAVSMGRLREDTQYDYKFVCVSHNTLRGAAGGAVELAELLAAEGYFD